MDEETIGKLIRLKRHEGPPAGYFSAFLREFHLRQRQELLKRSSLSLFLERLNTYLSDPRSQRWAYVPVLAIFALAFCCIIGMTDPQPPSMPTVAHIRLAPEVISAYAIPLAPRGMDESPMASDPHVRSSEDRSNAAPYGTGLRLDLSVPIEPLERVPH